MGQALDPVPLDLPPGCVLSDAPLAATGRFVDALGVRFVRGKAEKRGGYIALITTPLIGVPRGGGVWNDLTARQIIGVGTAYKLYAIGNNDFLPIDITPWVKSETTANPLTTTNGSALVTVAYTSHGAAVGQYIDISGAAAIGGIPAANLNGSFPITAVVDSNNIQFTAAVNATSGATGGGAAVTVGIEIAPGTVNAQVSFGWGAGPWGSGTWGTPRTTSTLVFYPRTWSAGNFGKIGIFCPSLGGIYSYDPTAPTGTRAAIIATAPTVNQLIVTTSDDIVIALGANFGGTQDPLSWWACAQGDYTNWNVTATAGPNGSPSVQARVNSGNRFLAAADLGIHVTLAWTDESLFAFQYVGNQFVFDVQRQGAECGIIGPLAYVVVDTKAYWVGAEGFWMYDGGVNRMPNQADILEYFLTNVRSYYSYQIVAWFDEEYNEICFAYVDQVNTENNRIVTFNREGNFWYPDQSIAHRTTALKFAGQSTAPLFFSDDGLLYQDNQGLDANGASKPWSLTYGTIEIANGGSSVEVDGVAVDMERQVGTISYQMTATDRTPAAGAIIDQQTNTGAPTDGVVDLRVAGRQMQLTLSGSGVGCDFRLGIPKLLRRAGGNRR